MPDITKYPQPQWNLRGGSRRGALQVVHRRISSAHECGALLDGVDCPRTRDRARREEERRSTTHSEAREN